MLLNRMMRAARLDVALFEEVEADREATSQAATVVAIVAACNGVGAALSAAMGGHALQAVAMLFGVVIATMIGWVIWAYITYWIGTKMFSGTATPGEMLRCLGFAQTPGVLGVLSFIPCLGGVIAFGASIWALVAAVIAIRQALDFDTGKAIMTAIVGWFVLFMIYCTIAAFFGVGSLALGALTGGR
ncbi:MAG: Yip1 family protein [Chloroflexota bacterium]